MKVTELYDKYPQYTHDQILKLRSVYYGIKGRTKSKSESNKAYWNVDFEFKDIPEFIDFIELERSKGRNYFEIDKPHISRLFDSGNYSPENCIILPAKQNVRQATGHKFQIFDALTGTTSYFTSVSLFYQKNKKVLNGISLSTLYRLIKGNKIIPVTDGITSTYIKIHVL